MSALYYKDYTTTDYITNNVRIIKHKTNHNNTINRKSLKSFKNPIL